MSLKARIEAVIYAAEEPVTLAQFAALFGADLCDECAARLSAEDASRETSPETMPDSSTLALEVSTDDEAAPAPEQPAVPEVEEPPEDVAKREAEEEKRAARQRERQARDEARRIIADLIADYATDDRGMEIREIAGGYRMATKPEYHDAVRGFIKSLKPPMKLSLPALETLAVIAYKQPVTAPEVSEIRGVDSSGVLGSLVSRKLITTAGRKQVIGRPILYKTTKEFLLRFGLKDLKDLPSMEEFEKMAGELVEAEDAAPEASAENATDPAPVSDLPSEDAAESPAVGSPDAGGEPATETVAEEQETE